MVEVKVKARVQGVKLPPAKLKCPECGGLHLIKDGWINRRGGRVQRYICTTCYRTTVNPVLRVRGRPHKTIKVE